MLLEVPLYRPALSPLSKRAIARLLLINGIEKTLNTFNTLSAQYEDHFVPVSFSQINDLLKDRTGQNLQKKKPRNRDRFQGLAAYSE